MFWTNETQHCFPLTPLQITSNGFLRGVLGPSDRFDSLEFEATEHKEYLPSTKLRQMFATSSPNNQTKSPKMTKTNPKSKKGQNNVRTITLSETDIPNYPVRADGVSEQTKMFLEVGLSKCECSCLWTDTDQNLQLSGTFSKMGDLFDFTHQNGYLSGDYAIQQYLEQAQNEQNQQNGNGNGTPQFSMPPGATLNGLQGHPVSALRNAAVNPQNMHSPSGGHLSLPGGPGHPMASPYMRNGGSPGNPMGMPMGGAMQMVAQHSQQGNSSSATASSSASPNASGKKRRASAVKLEGNSEEAGGGPHINGITSNPDPQGRNKSTPKMGKRQKNNQG